MKPPCTVAANFVPSEDEVMYCQFRDPEDVCSTHVAAKTSEYVSTEKIPRIKSEKSTLFFKKKSFVILKCILSEKTIREQCVWVGMDKQSPQTPLFVFLYHS